MWQQTNHLSLVLLVVKAVRQSVDSTICTGTLMVQQPTRTA